MLSAALSESGKVTKEKATEIISNLNRKHEARIRIVNREGRLLADSSSLNEDKHIFKETSSYRSSNTDIKKKEAPAQDSLLYRIVTSPVRAYRKLFVPPSIEKMPTDSFYSEKEFLLGEEVKAALEGRYNAEHRITSAGNQVTVTLYTAIPIENKKNIVGAIIVSQSTYKILKNLYELRLRIIEIFVGSLFFAILVSAVLSFTISRPLKKLRKQALKMMDQKGRLVTHFEPSKFKDEIGDLGNALHSLTRQVKKHTDFIESFASDLSHEFRNPLASIRSAGDVLIDSTKDKDQLHFLTMIQKDVQRLGKILSGAKEISLIDTRVEAEPKELINLYSYLSQILPALQKQSGRQDIHICLKKKNTELEIHIPEIRLYQICSNIIGNAAGFTPENGTITIELNKQEKQVLLSISDEGQGIPDSLKEKVFERFFSSRKEERDHSGLGLSIVQSILQSLNGSITIKDNRPKGSIFIVTFPL